jgi:hypothetical protein
MHPASVDSSRQSARKFPAKKDVLRDIKVGNKRELLEDYSDSQAASIARGFNMDGLAMDKEFALIRDGEHRKES